MKVVLICMKVVLICRKVVLMCRKVVLIYRKVVLICRSECCIVWYTIQKNQNDLKGEQANVQG